MVNEGPVDPERMKPSLQDLVNMIEGAGEEPPVSIDIDELELTLRALNDQDNQLLEMLRAVSKDQVAMNEIISDIANALLLLNTRSAGLHERVKGNSATVGLLLIWSLLLTVAWLVMLIR